MPEQRQVAVYLVAEDEDVVGGADLRDTFERLPAPDDAAGIVRVAEYQQTVQRVRRQPLQPFEVHLVSLQAAVVPTDLLERVVDDLVAVSLRRDAERVVHGWLDDDALLRLEHCVDNDSDAFHDARHVGEPMAFDGPLMMVRDPFPDRCLPLVGWEGIAKDRVIQSFPYRVDDEGRCGEIHVGHPQRQQVLPSEASSQKLMLHVVGARSVDYCVEIVFHKFVSELILLRNYI